MCNYDAPGDEVIVDVASAAAAAAVVFAAPEPCVVVAAEQVAIFCANPVPIAVAAAVAVGLVTVPSAGTFVVVAVHETISWLRSSLLLQLLSLWCRACGQAINAILLHCEVAF